MAESERGLTYAQAGVDIDAGNRMVDLIKPLVRATARPGADAEIGGFGGLFDLKRCGFKDPVLVAATDGVGTKLKIAVETAATTPSASISSPCRSTTWSYKARSLCSFSTITPAGSLSPEIGAAVVSGIAAGCKDAGCALIGGETAEMPGVYAGEDSTWPALPSVRPSADNCCRAATSRKAM